MNKIETWEKVFADKEFGSKILQMSPEDAHNELIAAGYDLDMNDMAEFAQEMKRVIDLTNENGELSEEMLAGVAGGKGHGANFVAGIVTGFAIVGGTFAKTMGW